jgi:hypothetical protein
MMSTPQVLWSASLITLVVMASGCDGGVQLKGRVTDASGAPVTSARVLLRDGDRRVRAEGQTDLRGCFELLEMVAPGRYSLRGEVTAPGFGSASVDVPTLNENTVRVRLVRANQGQSSAVMGEKDDRLVSDSKP